MSESVIKTIRHEGLTTHVLRALKAAIMAGELDPDRVLSIGELAKRFGTSRTPVREAVLELRARRIVEVVRGVGFRVVMPNYQEARDVYEIRLMLEVPAIRRLAGNISPSALKRAQEMVEELQPYAAQGDLASYLELDRDLHVFLVSLSGNERLTELVAELRDAQRIPGLTAIADASMLRYRNEMHLEILNAVARGDGDHAADVLSRHIALSIEDWERAHRERAQRDRGGEPDATAVELEPAMETGPVVKANGPEGKVSRMTPDTTGGPGRGRDREIVDGQENPR